MKRKNKADQDKYIERFCIAVCPESPNLFLMTGEKNIFLSATNLINDLRAELAAMCRDPCDCCKHSKTRHCDPPCCRCSPRNEWPFEPKEQEAE